MEDDEREVWEKQITEAVSLISDLLATNKVRKDVSILAMLNLTAYGSKKLGISLEDFLEAAKNTYEIVE